MLFAERLLPRLSPLRVGHRLAGEFHRVTRILRGDAIEVEGVGSVRMIGIQTPDGKSPREIYGVHGDRALSFVEKSLLGNEVRLEYDSAGDRDGSGQLAAYVYTRDGVLINAEMAKQGLAFVRGDEQFRLANDFLGYEREALHSMRGVWASSSSASSTASAAGASSTFNTNLSSKVRRIQRL